MMKTPETKDLSLRTKNFALRIMRLYAALPKNGAGRVVGQQLLRSGMSVGAQYREGKRARSVAEFVSKLESAIQELEETLYWLELLVESAIMSEKKLHDLMQEGHEVLSMLIASAKTAKRRRDESGKKRRT